MSAWDENQMVIEHNKGNSNGDLDYVEAGVLCLKKGALALIKTAPTSLEAGLYQKLIKRRELAAFKTGHRFFDMGTPEQRQVLEYYLEEKSR